MTPEETITKWSGEAQELMHNLWELGDKIDDSIESYPWVDTDDDDPSYDNLNLLKDSVNEAGWAIEISIGDIEKIRQIHAANEARRRRSPPRPVVAANGT